jgi:hypothetical protein
MAVQLLAQPSFRRIDATAVAQTVERLEARLATHFPESNLRRVARELLVVARDAPQRIRRIRRRSAIRRALAWILCAAILAILGTIPFMLRPGHVDTLAEAIGVIEAALSASFFIGATLLFLLTWESRMRQRRTIEAVHELRALAHVVDMHQLTKDPPLVIRDDPVSPAEQQYTRVQLQRYLDACSDMLALISKVAVLYAQDTTDPAAMGLIDDIEDLTNGMSRKIWQKISMLERSASASAAVAQPAASPPSLEPARVPPQTVATQ